MPHYTDYRCMSCGRETLRELLTVKKVVFAAMGAGGKIVKSRTLGYLCDECIKNDPEYQLEAYKSAPGMKSEPLERVRAMKAKSRGSNASE